MTDIAWENPPPPQGGNTTNSTWRGRVWNDLIEGCQANPGKWARHPAKFAGSGTTAFKTALRLRGLARGDWQVTTRVSDDPDDKLRVVYVRYIGGES